MFKFGDPFLNKAHYVNK